MPITVVCDQCDSRYNLKDELAGKKLKCKKCGNILVAPELDEPADEIQTVDRGYHPAFARDKFLMNQKRISISSKYYVFDERGNPILYIERPSFIFRTLLAVFGASSSRSCWPSHRWRSAWLSAMPAAVPTRSAGS